MARLIGLCILLLLLVSADLGASEKFQYKNPYLLFDADVKRSTNVRLYNRAVRGSHGTLIGFSHDATDGFRWSGILRSLLFDGDGDRVIVSLSSRLDSSDNVTFVVVAQVTDTTALRALMVAREAVQGTGNEYSYLIRHERNKIRFYARNIDNGDLYFTEYTQRLLDLNHLVLVRDGSNIIAYANGDSIGSDAIDGRNPNPVDSLLYGNYQFSSSEAPLIGTLCAGSVYNNRALTANEVAVLYRKFQQQGRPGYPIFDRPRRRFGPN